MYKALKSFIGKVSMSIGQTREIFDKKLAKELLEAGYIEEVKADKPMESKAPVKKNK